MKTIIMTTIALMSLAFATDKNEHSFYKLKAIDIEEKEFLFSSLKGKKVMIVNTASECGYTPQYKDLESLYKKYKDKKFVIIGFPSNDFGAQEPGTSVEIHAFCTINYGVTFPLMKKAIVKGENMHPVYQWLTKRSENEVSDNEVSWNFNKYLIDENGKFVKHLSSKVTPMDKEIIDWIERPANN